MSTAPGRYVQMLGVLFALVSAALAIDLSERNDWALENALVVLFVIVLVATYRSYQLSSLSYTLIVVFLCLHEVGAHYTYSKVPYDEWSQQLFGRALNAMLDWERNHFDRVVHFCYGLLPVYPARELVVRAARVRGFWSYLLPLTLVMSTSMVYELLEWAAAEIFGGDLGTAYVGTQGDEWDGQKEMALASLGASMTTMISIKVRHGDWEDPARSLPTHTEST